MFYKALESKETMIAASLAGNASCMFASWLLASCLFAEARIEAPFRLMF